MADTPLTDRPGLVVIIPVYRGLAETRRCVESVLRSELPSGTRVLLIDDASPEEKLSAYCRKLAEAGSVELLVNPENRGFVASVNRAMAHCEAADVLLLNSDCEVAGDWLVRIRNCAYRDERTATVTPFSNNATICSYPEFCGDNPLLSGFTVRDLDNIFLQVNAGADCILPTAVGFCMYIRRACLEQVGLFDEQAFGRGYGEENDFCQRAIEMGWQHKLAADVFVFHQGSVSFADDKGALVASAEAAVAAKHPDFFDGIRQFIQRDPLAGLRDRVTDHILAHMSHTSAAAQLRVLKEGKTTLNTGDFSALQSVLQQLSEDKRPRLLFVSHAWGGGVEQHLGQLSRLLANDYAVVVLRGLGDGGVEIELPGASGPVRHRVGGFGVESLPDWVACLRAFGFVHLHLHHVHGWPHAVFDLIDALGLPYDVTLHDYFAISPSYHLQDADAEGVERWVRRFAPVLQNADRVIAPSRSVLAAVQARIPEARYCLQPHPEKVVACPAPLKVALLGALSAIKGLDLVRQVAWLAAASEPPVSLVLIGHSAEPLDDVPIRVTGSYAEVELQRLIADERPDLLWLPSQVPETYSFTLTHALVTGLPIVASDVGALPERLRDYPEATLLPPDASPDQWLQALLAAATPPQPHAREGVDTLADYRAFYVEPLPSSDYKSIDVAGIVDFLQRLPEPQVELDLPVKDLFRIAVHGGHRGSLREFERRLLPVPAEEKGLAGAAEFQRTLEQLGETERELAALEEALDRYQENLDIAKSNIAELQDQARAAKGHIDHLDEKIAGLEANCLRLEAERDLLLNSFSWKITRPLRVAGRAVRRLLRVGRLALRHSYRPSSWLRALRLIRLGQWRLLLGSVNESRAVEDGTNTPLPQGVDSQLLQPEKLICEKLVLPTSDEPLVSILIPVYGQHATTYACVKSLADNPPSVPWELVIMDDCSPEPAAEALSMVIGAVIERNPENLGFLGNVNAGLAKTRGEYVLLLNNDTVLCPGAVDQMLSVFDTHHSVGLVGAKLLNRDGSIQEAGGIVWRDGSAWNWGRNADRLDPRFNYVREVDYCSGAALLIRRELFLKLGGFDPHYKPAYYEDTDLAFRVRQKGLRVMYQPAAEIYHLEGVSHGKDESNGIKSYQTVNAEKFFQRWQGELLNHRENAVAPELEANRYSKGHVLVVDACMLRPDQDSGSLRMFNLLSLLVEEGFRVTFVADNLEHIDKYVRQLQAIGVQVYHGGWTHSIRQLLRRLGDSLDVVFLCRHYVAVNHVDAVRRYASSAQLVFDTVDLHFVREEREAELNGDAFLQRTAAATRRQELGLVAKADVTLVVSSFEKELLAKLLPEARVEIVSNIHVAQPHRPGYEDRRDILFVGGFQHTPNIDAVKWYASEVLPHLCELLPGVVTRIVGSRMPDDIKALDCEQLRTLGFVEDLAPLLSSARVSIAPLRYGAGVKGKVNEAMNYGIPVVATACAVEGMHLRAGEEVLVAEAPRAFAEAIAKVYLDPELWQKLSVAGVRNVETHFSPKASLPALRRVLQEK